MFCPRLPESFYRARTITSLSLSSSSVHHISQFIPYSLMRDLNSGRTNVMRDSSTYTKWWSTGEKCGSSSLNTSVIKGHVSHCFYGGYVCYSSYRHWFNSRVAAGSHVQNYCMTIYRKRGLHVTFLPHRLTFWYFTSVYTDTLIQPTAPSVSCILIGVMFEVTQSEYVICQLISSLPGYE